MNKSSPAWNPSSRFSDAIAYALYLHGGDARKGTSLPYMSHLFNVCGLVIGSGGSEDEAIAALLHDSLEDHPDKTNRADIERRFGARVAEIVAECSDTSPDYSGGNKEPWKVRKSRYLDRVRRADAGTRLVSAADKLDNARAVLADLRRLGDALWTRFNAGRDEQLWYYRSLAEVFLATDPGSPVSCELARVVAEIERM